VAAVGAVEYDLFERTTPGLEAAARRLAEILEGSIREGFPPGATLSVVDADGPLVRVSGGFACIVGDRIPTTSETVYDLASLTKVVATVTLALSLAEEGAWSLDDPVSRWLPDVSRDDLTLRRLLTHTSGLVPHREFFRVSRGVAAIRSGVVAETVDAMPGPVDYSDLGYMLAGWALEDCTGAALDRLFAQRVARPLAMTRSQFRPPPKALPGIAATELDGDQRLEPGLVWGEVHDGNAWALGGIAGHAGLFAPIADLELFVQALLGPASHPVLSGASIAEMTRFQAGEPPDVRALGWRLDASEWGPWPRSTYWHTGFTGTSILIAPELGLGVVLLMGGVHPVRRLETQNKLRSQIHRTIATAL
jgi:CubicO group peptidase (beta-lactamase class C family)